ncbi:unnamed protein product [Prunus armeniaca]
MYEAKKTLSALGMSYEKIHACPNDCILCRKDYEDSTNCPTCGISRWNEGKDSILKESANESDAVFSANSKPKNDIDVYLEPLIDDLKSPWDEIRGLYDAHIGEYFALRDVMHIEKNICDSIIGTLLEIPGKNKDGIAVRLDLLNKGVKTDLQPDIKFPEDYSSNIKNLVSLKDSRLLSLKSHDCHTLVQQLLPEAIRSVLKQSARYAITRLCFFFNAICAKMIDVSKLDKLEEDNHTSPECCIAEQYIAEEAVEFCTEYLSNVRTVRVPSSHNLVDRDLLNQAHLFVLENTDEVLHHIEYVRSELNGEENNGVSENLRWLAAGPSMAVPSYWSYLINDVKFNTKAQDGVRTVQNSGVYLLAHTMQVASAKDKNTIVSKYGFLWCYSRNLGP